MAPLDIAFFGSSLVSAYWNGAATYYRGILRALAARGHRIRFYEPDAYDRQSHRDIPDPPWAQVIVYPAEGSAGVRQSLDDARDADVLIKASGVGVADDLLEAEIVKLKQPSNRIVFWDVDAPATLERMRRDPSDPLRRQISRYDMVLTYGGGDPVIAAYTALGARACVPIYNALDPSTHHPVPPDPRFACDLVFLGNRLPDREARVDALFFDVARTCPGRRFLLGGAGWESKALPANVTALGHVYTRDHNALNSSAGAILNISREAMAATGFSPATRVFEAAGAAACIITDAWKGIDRFLEPGTEILVAHSGGEVGELLAALSPHRARAIGEAARRRVLAEHTYEHRAVCVEQALAGAGGKRA